MRTYRPLRACGGQRKAVHGSVRGEQLLHGGCWTALRAARLQGGILPSPARPIMAAKRKLEQT